MEREFQSTSALSIRCSIGIRSLISIDILTIMNGIQQSITTHRVRRVIRQVQNKEAGVRHRVVSIRISSIQLIDRVLSIPSLFTNRYPHPFPLLQRQSRTTPDELQVQFSLLVWEVLQHLPEVLNHRTGLLVAIAILCVLLQQLDINIGTTHDDRLQLLLGKNWQEMTGNLRRQSSIYLSYITKTHTHCINLCIKLFYSVFLHHF